MGKIAVVDYGAGNLRSIENAFRYLKKEVKITSDASEIDAAEKVVFPGVGAFGFMMKNLQRKKLDGAIKEAIAGGKPLLGICLGLQALFGESEESPGVKGLGVLQGKVVRFTKPKKIPQIGWNQVKIGKKCKLFDGIKNNSNFYFVHSYYVRPADESAVAATTNYEGEKFASAAAQGNLFAVQFHPEKSGTTGLRILKNFAEM